jgi:uncharacterized cupredoxin-like copper-binding protein
MRLTAVLVLAMAFAGCGGDDSTASSSTAAPTAAPTAAVPAGTVVVKLIDVDAQTEAMTLSSNTSPAGTVTFEVTNTGSMVHEFVVISTDLAAADLPFDDAKDEVIEDAPGLTPVDEIEDIKAGETKTLQVELPAGHYALICNITKHWREGMRADFNVT